MRKMITFFFCIISVFLISMPITYSIYIDNSKKNLHLKINDIIHQKSFFNSSVGYTLFAPTSSKTTYLINKDKETIFTWDSEYTPGLSVYLLKNGNILRTAYLGIHQTFRSGGMGGAVQEIDRDGKVIWEFKYSNDFHLSHHDVEYLPNGNVLMIAWEVKTAAEAIEKGRNPDLIKFDQIWPDHIIEVKPTGPKSGDIVWEWHVWDHMIQDYNPSKENYGVIKDHPELIDINFVEKPYNIHPDWNHINSVAYNEAFDQILLSVNYFNEIWIIDHSTTTEEAAGHTSGIYGRGGDLLYRWGNPRAYKRGDLTDQFFYKQHDAQWIDAELPGAGNILVFNNGDGHPDGSYSSVVELIPPNDENGFYDIIPGLPYEPLEPFWVYKANNPFDFFSKRACGAQRLSNGNTLICNSVEGTFFEVTSDKETVWKFVNPYPNPHRNSVFKIRQYLSDYPGILTLLNHPNKPIIDGPKQGKPGIEYCWSFQSTDPNGDQIKYIINWGDETMDVTECYSSGEPVTVCHTYNSKGKYIIEVIAQECTDDGLQSDVGNFMFSVPRYRDSYCPFWLRLSDFFLILQNIL